MLKRAFCDHSNGDNRLELELRTRVEQAGLFWAERWFDRVLQQGRLVAGAWPGTMSEARAQVLHAVLPWLHAQGKRPGRPRLGALPNFEALAGVLYSTARAAWLHRSHRAPSAGAIAEKE